MPPFNGSGTFTPYSPGNPVVTNTTISSTAFNNTINDIATGLSTAITKDGQTTATANLPMGGYKLTGLGAGSAATDSANLSQVQSGVAALLGGVAGTNTITATGSPTLTAYASGQTFRFIPAATNTGATTINIDSLGAKNVYYRGAALGGGEIRSGVVAHVTYDGTQFNLVDSNGVFPAGTASAPAIVAAGDANTGVFFPAADTVAVTTGGTEQWRTDSSGNTGFGVTAVNGSAADGVGVEIFKSGYVQLIRDNAQPMYIARTVGTGTVISFGYGSAVNNSGEVGTITTNGSTITFSGNALSDARYKQNIAPIQDALRAVCALEFVTFDFVSGRASAGVTSQQAKTVPQIAPYAIDGVTEDDYIAFDYNALIGYLGQAIKELKAEFDAYKATHP